MFAPFLKALGDPLLRVAFLSILLLGPAAASIGPFQSVIGIERLGMQNGAYAAVVTAGAFLGVAASVAIGIVIDQTRSYRGILLATAAVGVASGAVMGTWPGLPAFLLVHLVLFPVAATTFNQCFALAAVAVARNPALDGDIGISLVRAGFAATFAISPPLWGLALARGVDLLSVYWALAGFNLAVLGVLLLAWPSAPVPAGERGSGLSFNAALRELTAPPVLLRLGLVTAVTSANGLYAILLGLLIVTVLGGQEADIGWFAGGVALVELPVMLGAALLLRRHSRVSVILAGASIYAVSLVSLGLMPSIAAAWWLILPFGVGAGIILSVPVGYIQGLVAHRPGAGSSLISMSFFGGTLIASALFAAGTEPLGYVGVAVLGGMLSLLAAGLLFRIERP